MTATTLAAIGGVSAIVSNSLLLLTARSGLPHEPLLMLCLLGYGGAVISLAVGIEALVRHPIWRTVLQPIALVGLLLLPIIFFAQLIWLALPVAAILACAVLGRSRLPQMELQLGLIAWFAPAMCLIVAIGLYGLAGFQHGEMQTHFFMPEYAALGLLHQDPMSYATFAAQIMRGQWPGQALHGLQPMFYHFGIHWIFASLSAATASTAFHVYMQGQQLLLIPLAIFYAGLATASLCRMEGVSEPAGVVAVVLTMGGVMAISSLGWPILFYSESSSVAAPFAFLLLPIASAWLRAETGRRLVVVHILALIFAALAPALFKISTAMITAPMGGYLVLRRWISSNWSDLASVVGVLLALICIVLLWPSLAGHAFEFRLWEHAQAEFVAVRQEGIWLLCALAAALVLDRGGTALALSAPRFGPLWHVFLVMLLMALLGAWIIGNVHRVYNGRYLFNTLLLLAIPLLAARAACIVHFVALFLERRLTSLKSAVWPTSGGLLVIAMAVCMEASDASPSFTYKRLDGAIAAMCTGANPQSACLTARPRPFTTASPQFLVTLSQGIGPRTIDALRAFDLEAADGLFVPPHNGDYWKLILGGSEPYQNLNFLPAHFGITMLHGLPPANLGLDLKEINAPLSTRYDVRARSRPISDAELCRHGREHKMARVWVYESLGPPAEMRLLDCGQTG